MQLFIFLSVATISFVGIVVMLSYRLWEINGGRVFTVSQKNISMRVFVQQLFKYIFNFEKRSIQKTKKIIYKIKKHDFSNTVLLIQKYLPIKYFKEKIEKLYRKNNLNIKRDASPFLKSIATHKENIRNGEAGEDINEKKSNNQ